MSASKPNAGLSKVDWTLPLAEGNYPFSLSADEQRLSPDQWAWFFLRLNPQYQHDYQLWKDRSENWKGVRDPYSVFALSGKLLQQQLIQLQESGNFTDFQSILVDGIANLDSRYFALDGEPLGNKPSYLQYEASSFIAYLQSHYTGTNFDAQVLQRLRPREMDAPLDYGIGAWVNPNLRTLPAIKPQAEGRAIGLEPPLPWKPSWFFHVNEPIWSVNSWILRSGEPATGYLVDKQRVQFGLKDVATIVEETQIYATDGVFHDPARVTAVGGHSLPLKTEGLSATEFYFLVCLDGYVHPQVDMAFRIAEKYRATHKKYYPQNVRRGAQKNNVEVLAIDQDLARRSNAHASRIRKNWCKVTIDVAGALPKQKSEVSRRLLTMQDAQGDALTFPIRSRARNEAAIVDNALKRALCVFELHRHGMEHGYKKQPMSQHAMSNAIYCESDPSYYEIRGLLLPPGVSTIENAMGSSSLDQIREAFELGRGMVLGWYEFVASRQFQTFSKPDQ